MGKMAKVIIGIVLIAVVFFLAADAVMAGTFKDWKLAVLNGEPMQRGELVSWDQQNVTLTFTVNGQTVKKQFRGYGPKQIHPTIVAPGASVEPAPWGIDERRSTLTIDVCPRTEKPYVEFRHLAESIRFPGFPLISLPSDYYDVIIYIR